MNQDDGVHSNEVYLPIDSLHGISCELEAVHIGEARRSNIPVKGTARGYQIPLIPPPEPFPSCNLSQDLPIPSNPRSQAKKKKDKPLKAINVYKHSQKDERELLARKRLKEKLPVKKKTVKFDPNQPSTSRGQDFEEDDFEEEEKEPIPSPPMDQERKATQKDFGGTRNTTLPPHNKHLLKKKLLKKVKKTPATEPRELDVNRASTSGNPPYKN